MQDYVTVNHLRSSGFDFNDSVAVMRINVIEQMERVLDKPPKMLDLKSKAAITENSIRVTFVNYYTDNYNKIQEPGDCYIDLGNGKVPKPIVKQVYATIKALIYLSTHKDPALAEAAARMCASIVMCEDNEITVDSMYKILSSKKSDNYYEKELMQGVRQAVFSDSEILLHWNRVSACGGWYRTGIEAGAAFIKERPELTIKELDKMLSTAYKEASQNKGWMARLVKKVPTKPLIGMLWLLYADNPSVLEPSGTSSFLDTSNRLKTVRSQDFDRVIRLYVYNALCNMQNVSVDECIAHEVLDAVAKLHAKKVSRTVEEVREAFVGGPGRLIVTNDSRVGALHVGKEKQNYVCTWN